MTNRLLFGIGDFVAAFKGDYEGHPFRGNQYDESGGSSINETQAPKRRGSKKVEASAPERTPKDKLPKSGKIDGKDFSIDYGGGEDGDDAIDWTDGERYTLSGSRSSSGHNFSVGDSVKYGGGGSSESQFNAKYLGSFGGFGRSHNLIVDDGGDFHDINNIGQLGYKEAL